MLTAQLGREFEPVALASGVISDPDTAMTAYIGLRAWSRPCATRRRPTQRDHEELAALGQALADYYGLKPYELQVEVRHQVDSMFKVIEDATDPRTIAANQAAALHGAA